MKIKINSVPNFEKGRIIDVPAKNGVPVEQFWRKRLRDAKIDKCCEVVKPSNKKAKPETTLAPEPEVKDA